MTDAHPHHPERVFWERFGSKAPSLAGKSVLEIGCGEGMRSFEAARQGASAVLGVDISRGAIDDANTHLAQAEPEIAGKIAFKCCMVEDLPDEGFDVAISEDTFEHILDPAAALAEIKSKLRPGGYAFIGFGPLYHSPFGDHGWIQSALPFGTIPWKHLLLPKPLMFASISRHYGRAIKDTVNWQFLALNQWTAADFLEMFKASGMEIVSLAKLRHNGIDGAVFDFLGRIPGFRKYCTGGLYCVLRK